MKVVKLTKLKELPDALHPNNISEGAIYYGYYIKEPVVGERFNIGALSHHPNFRGLSTSGIVRMVDEKTFETYSSIYQMEMLELYPWDSHIVRTIGTGEYRKLSETPTIEVGCTISKTPDDPEFLVTAMVDDLIIGKYLNR